MTHRHTAIATFVSLLVAAVSATADTITSDMSVAAHQQASEVARLNNEAAVIEARTKVLRANTAYETELVNIANQRKIRSAHEADTAKNYKQASDSRAATIEANAPTMSNFTVKISSIKAPSQSCDATGYVAYHCQGFSRCMFELSDQMCELPKDGTLQVTLTYSCGSQKKTTYMKHANPFGYLTCL